MNDKFYSSARAFVTTVRTGSMTAAAYELKSTKSGISQKISWFEAELGLKLFDRAARTVEPTIAGHRIFEICVTMVDAALEAEARLSEGSGKEISGRITISGPNTFLTTIIIPIVLEFISIHPMVRIEFKASDWNADFAAEDIDLGFRVGTVTKGHFIKKKLSKTHRQLFASPGFFEQHPKLSGPPDLTDTPCILRQQEARTWRLLGPNAQFETIKPSSVLLVDTMEMAQAASIEGAGVSFLPILVARADIEAGKLVSVLPQWHSEPIDVTLLCRPNSLQKPQVAAMRRFFIKRYDREIS